MIQKRPYESIEKIISNVEIWPTICSITNSTDVKNRNQPIIINISTTEKAPNFGGLFGSSKLKNLRGWDGFSVNLFNTDYYKLYCW
jgi:hypothetical protein